MRCGRLPTEERRTTREDKHLKKVMTPALALSALFAASGKIHADVNYPWCIIGDTRAVDCYLSSREQCMQDGRNRGFGSQCIKNPACTGSFDRFRSRRRVSNGTPLAGLYGDPLNMHSAETAMPLR
jgi:hypothetical protein